MNDANKIINFVEEYLGDIPLVSRCLKKVKEGADYANNYVRDNID